MRSRKPRLLCRALSACARRVRPRQNNDTVLLSHLVVARAPKPLSQTNVLQMKNDEDVRAGGRTGGRRADGRTGVRTDGWAGVRTGGRAYGRAAGGRSGGRADERAGGRTDGRVCERTDERAYGRVGGRPDGCADRRVGGRTDSDGRTDERMDERADGRTSRRTDGSVRPPVTLVATNIMLPAIRHVTNLISNAFELHSTQAT
ncbi:hypothetical protein EVAR_54434_1 [Eumeta japonica]|uniref:Uncharacterized protein n=1 Tax=Eumeta variegata TaxID=151549 RepID=A0A4C1YYY3_EUMVA|nr:hypothetical protein EVAR_54434_1 [Eumeta japonica]